MKIERNKIYDIGEIAKDEKSKSDGFETGVAEKTEECAWCGKVIHQYVSCYYGGQRVGNVIICKKCGDEGSALEDEAKYGARGGRKKKIKVENEPVESNGI